jgi:hypothetical protein
MALRASISLISLQASVSTERLTASTAYNKSEATEIWTDPDSKNRVVRDEMPLSEVHFTLLEKNLADAYNVTDSNTLSFDKASTDAISFTDTFVNVIAYHRKFNDAFTLDDLAAVDKDFYGNKGNIFAFTDIIGLTYAKELTDTYTVGDFIAAAVNKVAQDSFSFTDTSYATFSKTINDAFTLDDAAMIDKDYYGNKGNLLGVADIFARAVDYKRKFPGSLPLGSNLLNSNSLAASSTPDTRVIVEDFYAAATGKNVSDSLGFSDSNTMTITKVISDAFALDDATFINKDFAGSKSNIFSFTDVLTSAVSKVVLDSLGFTDVSSFSYNKNSSDSTLLTEAHSKQNSKSLQDNFSFSDVYGVQLTKNVSDAFALDDSALIDKDYFGNKGNIVGVTDQVTVEYFYGGLFGQRPLNRVQLN